MNHPLAVYTVIYLAIVFITVSIWGGRIGEATGDYRVLLLAQAVFGLKLAIDDYIHFQGAKDKLYADLCLSLLIYLLLAGSIATAASERGAVSAATFAALFVVGAVWLLISGFDGPERTRRLGWFCINILSAVVLIVVAFIKPPSTTYTAASGYLLALVLVHVFDFFCYGTLKRLAELHQSADHPPAAAIATVSAAKPTAGAAAAQAAEAESAPAKVIKVAAPAAES